MSNQRRLSYNQNQISPNGRIDEFSKSAAMTRRKTMIYSQWTDSMSVTNFLLLILYLLANALGADLDFRQAFAYTKWCHNASPRQMCSW